MQDWNLPDWNFRHQRDQKCKGGKCETGKCSTRNAGVKNARKTNQGPMCVVNVVAKMIYASKAITACRKHVKLFR